MSRITIVTAVLALAACGGSSGPATHFAATMSPANEVPSVTSSGTGSATYAVDGGTVSYTVTFSNLTGPAIAGHIHVGAAGVNGGVTVPFSPPAAASGTFNGTFTAADVKAATASDGGVSIAVGDYNGLLTLMRASNTYTNIHTNANKNGEIRGQNQPQ
jgi:hypothetical protein